jgi:hypothetical protein
VGHAAGGYGGVGTLTPSTSIMLSDSPPLSVSDSPMSWAYVQPLAARTVTVSARAATTLAHVRRTGWISRIRRDHDGLTESHLARDVDVKQMRFSDRRQRPSRRRCERSHAPTPARAVPCRAARARACGGWALPACSAALTCASPGVRLWARTPSWCCRACRPRAPGRIRPLGTPIRVYGPPCETVSPAH